MCNLFRILGGIARTSTSTVGAGQRHCSLVRRLPGKMMIGLVVMARTAMAEAATDGGEPAALWDWPALTTMAALGIGEWIGWLVSRTSKEKERNRRDGGRLNQVI